MPGNTTSRITRVGANPSPSRGEPRVRIHFPPAGSHVRTCVLTSCHDLEDGLAEPPGMLGKARGHKGSGLLVPCADVADPILAPAQHFDPEMRLHPEIP